MYNDLEWNGTGIEWFGVWILSPAQQEDFDSIGVY